MKNRSFREKTASGSQSKHIDNAVVFFSKIGKSKANRFLDAMTRSYFK